MTTTLCKPINSNPRLHQAKNPSRQQTSCNKRRNNIRTEYQLQGRRYRSKEDNRETTISINQSSGQVREKQRISSADRRCCCGYPCRVASPVPTPIIAVRICRNICLRGGFPRGSRFNKKSPCTLHMHSKTAFGDLLKMARIV